MHTLWEFVTHATQHNKRRVSISSKISDEHLTDIIRSHAYPRRKSMTECLEVYGRSKSLACMKQAKALDMNDRPNSFTCHFSDDGYRDIEISKLVRRRCIVRVANLILRQNDELCHS
jgi:hypothetical protein